MIRWILSRNWLSLSIISAMFMAFSAGIELISNNYLGLVFTGLLGIALLCSRYLTWVALAVMPLAAFSISYCSANAGLSILVLSVPSLLMAVFGNRAQRIWNLVASAVAVAIISWFVGYEGDYLHSLLAGSNSTELARVNSLLLILWYSTLLFSFVVVAGRLLFVKLEHIGSPKDRAIQLVTNEEYRFEIAKQNERLEIAKDLSQLLVQKLSAVVSVSEGGRYAIKSDPMSAERTLDRVYSAAKDAQSELRRLYDYLNSSIFSELASFRISDLQTLSVAYRELGYNTVIEENGQSFPLNDGVELCIYKIVFEALQNVRKHAPAGTDVDINFLWVENGLQVLVKDNGIEFSNRQRANVGQLVDGYSAEDDLESLTSEIDGATLAVLRDRAAIYNGRIEASLVPGVGFTLSAIFPNLKALSSKEPL